MVRAIGVAMSREIPDAAWYDAMCPTEEDAKYRRQLDVNNRRLEEAAEKMRMGA